MPDATVYQVEVASGPVYDVQVTSTSTSYAVQVSTGPTYQVEMQLGTGPAGPANRLTPGDAQTGEPGSAMSFTITGDPPNQVLNLTIPRGDLGKDLEFDWDGTRLGVRVAGDPDYQYVALQGMPGDPGPGLEFQWDVTGTKLGVRPVGSTGPWTYSGDLTGPAGAGSGDVTGPATATDGHMAVFDATGKAIRDGGAVPTLASLGGQPEGDYASAAQGAKADSAVQGDDARLSNDRTPTAHAASHATGGTDPIPAASIGAIRALTKSPPSIIVLAAAEAIPAGTPAGTVIVRQP